MNTQSLDLNKMGLAPMQSSEMQEVEGGLVDVFGAVGYAVGYIVGTAYKALPGALKDAVTTFITGKLS